MHRRSLELSRRNFFRGAAQASVAGALVSGSLSSKAEAYTPGGEEMRGRYRVTDHVKAYYATNAYETKIKK